MKAWTQNLHMHSTFDDGKDSCRKMLLACRKAGLPCALIGYLTSGPARIIKNGDSVRYLDRPQEDALNVLRM